MKPLLTSQPFQELQQTLHARTDSGAGGIVVSFSGEWSLEVTDALILLTSNGLRGINISRKIRNRVNSVLVECLQNVSRHGWIDDQGEMHLYLTVESTPLGIQIQSGNLVDLEMASALRDKISEVNGMTHEALRVKYVQQLCNSDWSEKGGAGLGLISMAKKSSGPLDYTFRELNSGLYMFTLAIMVKSQ